MLTSARVKAAEKFFNYDTPAWAASELWDIFGETAELRTGASGVEPTCGKGNMLAAVPASFPVVGIEIDPERAKEARRTGREVLTGDVLTLPFPCRFDFAFGNPPFSTKFQDALLERFAQEMAEGFRCGLINPAYFLQTPRRVMRWNSAWSIYVEMLPRTLFPGLRCPLVFATFTKDPTPKLRGLRLYAETHAVHSLPARFRESIANGQGMWLPVVVAAMQELGGVAHLADVYDVIGSGPSTANKWVQNKIRQTIYRHPTLFESISARSGRWRLAGAAYQMEMEAVA